MTKIAPVRIEGPAGVRIVAPIADGQWAIQWEAGPTKDDPSCASQAEAVEWATATVNAKGKPFPPGPRVHGGSPNERVDALAKAQLTPRTPSAVAAGRRR